MLVGALDKNEQPRVLRIHGLLNEVVERAHAVLAVLRSPVVAEEPDESE
jgi:hypothetical protein